MNKPQIPKITNTEAETPKTSKNWFWSILFVVIALGSIFAVVVQCKSFSLSDFSGYIKGASPLWLAISLLSMFAYIVFEGLALLIICRAFGYRTSFSRGYIYSASDIYFSAITPSATGGQPASAYFMMKDGMSGMMVTTALLVNLCMYTLSIVVIGLLCFSFRFDLFLNYSVLSKILIVAGTLIQIGLAVFFSMLLLKEKLLHKISSSVLSFLCKIRLLRHKSAKQEKLDKYMENYRRYSTIISKHHKTLWFVFLFNFLQRVTQIAITMFVYMATTGKSFIEAVDLWFFQGYTVLGANCMPVPGGIGVSDYLMLDGFGSVMSEHSAVNLELLSRALSFYFCVIICGISVLIRYLTLKKRGSNK